MNIPLGLLMKNCGQKRHSFLQEKGHLNELRKVAPLMEIDGFISPSPTIQITKGVRYGCPVPALVLNLDLEPVVRHLIKHPAIESAHSQKVII